MRFLIVLGVSGPIFGDTEIDSHDQCSEDAPYFAS